MTVRKSKGSRNLVIKHNRLESEVESDALDLGGGERKRTR